MLRERYEVKTCAFADPEKWKTPLLFLKQLGFLLTHFTDWRNSMVMCQFAGYHSFLPCLWAWLLKRPSIIVVGGTDCVSFPSLGYGHFQNRLLSAFTRLSYRFVTTVSAVHSSLFLRDNPYAGDAERKQGILQFYPQASFRQNVIPNGFDTDWFRIETPFEKRPEMSFISISVALDDPIRVKLKGIDMVLALAAKMPDARFTLIGTQPNPSISVPSNVTLVPFVPNKDLKSHYNQHRFYLQLSISEGFPNALCEAMACGCIPIVSEVASMPEIAGHYGLVIPLRESSGLYKRVQDRLQKAPVEEAACSREVSASISSRFPWSRRRTALWELVDGLAV